MSDGVLVKVVDTGDPVVVEVHGGVYFGDHEPLQDTLVGLAQGRGRRIVVDLAGVPACDSSGLNILIKVQREVAAGGGWLRLAGARPLVRRVLDVTHLTRILPLFDTVAEATAAPDQP